jgi:pyruvate formate lyase activating enzyme
MISQEKIGGTDLPPSDVVRATRDNNCQGISYTYTEPTIFLEYAYDIAKLAHQVSFFNTFVTNGYMTREAVHTIAPYLDAATVDFKAGADPDFYRKFSAVPSVEPIFASLLEMKRHDIHVEITNLVIPKTGDSLERIKDLATWIRDKMGKDTVFHLLRFHPEYKMTDLISTPIQTLEKACTISREVGLNYVYIGNVPGHPYENTYCPKCHEMVIKRFSFEIVRWNLTKDMRCPACGRTIPIKGPFEPTGAAYPHSIV